MGETHPTMLTFCSAVQEISHNTLLHLHPAGASSSGSSLLLCIASPSEGLLAETVEEGHDVLEDQKCCLQKIPETSLAGLEISSP